jgi:endonuclease/exonuclease/phosphatase family metal-dependent hydrolase
MSTRRRGLVVLSQNLWYTNARAGGAVGLNNKNDELASEWPARRAALQGWLRALAPDVICLQEVLQGPGVDMLAELFPEGSELYAQWPHRRFAHASPWWRDKRVSFGNAIVSRFPITASAEMELPVELTPGDVFHETRSVLCCTLQVPHVGPVTVSTTHLNYKLHHAGARTRQAIALAAFVERHRPRGAGAFPAILCGDLNAKPGEEAVRYLTGQVSVRGVALEGDAAREEGLHLRESVYFVDSWAHAGRPRGGKGYTWCSYNPNTTVDLEEDKRIDYILSTPPRSDGVGLVEECRVVCDHPYVGGCFPSDHFGVLAEFRVEPHHSPARAKL